MYASPFSGPTVSRETRAGPQWNKRRESSGPLNCLTYRGTSKREKVRNKSSPHGRSIEALYLCKEHPAGEKEEKTLRRNGGFSLSWGHSHVLSVCPAALIVAPRPASPQIRVLPRRLPVKV